MQFCLRPLAVTALVSTWMIGCGGLSPRTLPPSNFALEIGQARGGASGLASQAIPDYTFTFHYKGAEELQAVDLTMEVEYASGDKQKQPLHLDSWKPNTSHRVRLYDQVLRGKPKGVFLSGKARIGKESVAISVRWSPSQSGN